MRNPLPFKVSFNRLFNRRVALSVLGVAVVASVLFVVFSMLPKHVEMSYAAQTCVDELTILPAIQPQRTQSGYELTYRDSVRIGSVELMSKSVCFRPLSSPGEGEQRVAVSLWGGPLVSQVYWLDVPASPQLNTAVLENAIPTTKPLELPLDKPDGLHRYVLSVGTKRAACQSGAQQLVCGLETLSLAQGKTYNYEISRNFAEAQPKSVTTGTLKTLRAVTVKSASVKKDQVVYAKPTSFRVEFDKSVRRVDAQLTTGDSQHPITIAVDGKKATINTTAQLERSTDYTLTLQAVEAIDGSTLVDPYTVPFVTSDGPKVASVSIGTSGVAANERVIVTFDQPLSADQAAHSFVIVQGAGGTVSRLNDTQVAIQLSGLGRCTAFTISVKAGVASKYGVVNTKGWQHASRSICYSTRVYGASVQKRPLIAYIFGTSGPLTLYTGAIHGNEVSSKYMMDAWVAELDANPGKIGNRRVVVIPSINPDGVAAGTRNNSRNVNLSRNFPTSNWVSDINDTNGPLKGGGGKVPLSEPEAAALASYTRSLGPGLLVSYHAVGSLVVGDQGGYSAGKAAQYAQLVGYRNATGQSGTFDYDITGAYEEWTYKNAGIPSMVVELGSYSYYNFAYHRAAMWAMLD